MYLPDYLFYDPQSQMGSTLTAKFTGNLDGERAAVLDPVCWNDTDLKAARAKKKIVLSDYWFETLDDISLVFIQAVVKILLAEGFEVFLWQEEELFKFNDHNTSTFISQWARNKCTPVHPSKIAAKLNQDPEGLFIAGYGELMQAHLDMTVESEPVVQGEEDDGVRWSYVSSLYNSRFSLKEILAVLDKNRKWMDTDNDPWVIKYAAKHNLTISDSNPLATDEIPPYEYASDLAQAEKHFIDSPELLGITISSIRLRTDQDIRDFLAKYMSFPEELKNKLRFTYFMLGTPEIDRNFRNLPDTPISESLIIEMLSSGIHVDKLSVESGLIDSQTLDLHPQRSIKSVSISSSMSNQPSTSRLLTILSEVEKLDLYSLPSAQWLKDNSWVKLTELDVKMSPELDVDALAQCAPNLHRFSLHMPERLTGEQITSVRELDVTFAGSQASRLPLHELLKRFPKVDKLAIKHDQSNLPLFKDDPKEFYQSLKGLKSLTIDAHPCPHGIDIGQILSNTPELTDLTLLGDIQWNDFNAELLANPLKLKHLSISQLETSKDAHRLIEIIKRCPLLTELNLATLDNLAEMVAQLDGLVLEHLTEIEVNTSNLTLESYQLLRKIAPNLRKLTISNSPVSEQLSQVEQDITIGSTPIKVYIRGSTKSNQSKPSSMIDSNTTNPPQTYNINKIFYDIYGNNDPAPSHYRIDVYNNCYLTADPERPFSMVKDNIKDLKPYYDYRYGESLIQTDIDRLKARNLPGLYAMHEMDISDTFQPLPSKESYEKLKALYVAGLSDDQIEINYNTRDNLYYIRKKTPGTLSVKIEYVLDLSAKPPALERSVVQPLLDAFKAFGEPRALDRSKLRKNPSSHDVLEAMFKQGLGRCEQRTAQFMTFAKEQYGMDKKIRVNANDCHVFVEVYENNHWYTYDLGGYPATLNVRDNRKQKIKAYNPEVTTISTPDIYMVPRIEELDPKHVTWKQQKPNAAPKSPAALAEEAFKGKRVLLQCQDDKSADELMLALQYRAKHTSTPVFVIDNPEQIACASHWLARDLTTNAGQRCPPPGGPLYDFLTQDFSQYANPPVLLVNWNNFNANQLIQHNSLIDDIRKANNTLLPESMRVVGVYNTEKPNAYKHSDFYSRNKTQIDVVGSSTAMEQYNQRCFPLAIPTNDNPLKAVDIELYGSKHWKSILVGKWVIDKGRLVYQEGELTKALKTGQAVHLKNAPWHIPAFKRFWRQARIQGSMTTYGETIPIPDAFWSTLSQSEGYQWQQLASQVSFVTDASKLQRPLALNAKTLGMLNEHYVIKNSLPVLQPSILASYQNQTLSLLLTDEITTADWALLFNEAKRHQVTLTIAAPDNIPIPESLKQALQFEFLNTPYTICQDLIPQYGACSLIQSTDMDLTARTLQQQLAVEGKKPLVIDISDLDESDILHRIDADFSNQISFNAKLSDIWKKLANAEKGETVILKGKFSQSLKDALANLMLPPAMLRVNGEEHALKGRLLVVSDEEFSPALAAQNVNVSQQEKLEAIFAEWPGLTSQQKQAIRDHNWAKLNYTQIRASVLHYLRTHPPSFDRLTGVLKATSTPPDPIISMDDAYVNQVADGFNRSRLSAINSRLETDPCVFVSGQSGVGKTEFMGLFLTPDNGYILYNELSALKAWANDRTPNKKITLFLDEANISNSDFMIFAGLYENPPYIIIEGDYIELSPEHKLVLVGNPMSYGGERHLPELIAQHGNAITFTPLPPELIWRDVLSGVFKAAEVAPDRAKQYGRLILDTYAKICAMSEAEILISPRELRAMAMMIVANPNSSVEQIVHQVAHQCLPDDKKAEFQKWFKTKYPYQPKQHHALNTQVSEFVLTPSRQVVHDDFQHLLQTRALMLRSGKKEHHTIGLGGMILQGAPGTGKTVFFQHMLAQAGYHCVEPPEPLVPTKENPNPKYPKLANPNVYYYISASMSFEEKERIHLAAFEQGACVVTDEINSSPIMEQLLNSLLNGKHPKTKKASDNPGYMLFATQNPPSMGGRQQTSPAILRRVMFEEFSDFTPPEMQAILAKKFTFIPADVLAKEITAHTKALKYARANYLQPEPVFRNLHDLMKVLNADYQRKANKIWAKTLQNSQPHQAKAQEAKNRPKTVAHGYENRANSPSKLAGNKAKTKQNKYKARPKNR